MNVLRYLTFLGERSRAGATDVNKELRLRLAAATLRRRASEAVLAKPARYVEIIREVAKAEAMQIASGNRAAGKQFIQWAEGADLAEILYPEALRAVERHALKTARPVAADPAFKRDLKAALTIR